MKRFKELMARPRLAFKVFGQYLSMFDYSKANASIAINSSSNFENKNLSKVIYNPEEQLGKVSLENKNIKLAQNIHPQVQNPMNVNFPPANDSSRIQNTEQSVRKEAIELNDKEFQ
ncbi:MAG: hypothetical protein HRT47_09220 [Candidatus Caenarcaniphilales bacterium]|nr:hypothetical protein [Candidatus Caenarcaniphilales bacterium]